MAPTPTYKLIRLLSSRGISTIGRSGVGAFLALAFLGLCLPAAASAATGAISGSVTALKGGAAVQGAEVCALRFDGSEAGCARTAADGSYLIEALQPRSYEVEFSAGSSGLNVVTEFYDDARYWYEADEVAVASEATTSGIDAALAEGGWISGRVTAAATGAPLAAAEVCAWSESEVIDGCVQTAADGTYTIAYLHPGSYWVVMASDAAEYWATYYPAGRTFSEGVKVPVLEGANTPWIDAALTLAGRISGHVYAASDRRPLAEIYVCAVSVASGDLGPCEETGDDGAYRLSYMRPGAYKVAFSLEFREFFPGEPAEPDGWKTQFWNLKSKLSEADVLNVGAGSAFDGVDALLGYKPPAPPAPSSQAPTAPPATVKAKKKPLRCKKGLVKKRAKGKVRCVHKPRHKHQRRHKHHRGQQEAR